MVDRRNFNQGDRKVAPSHSYATLKCLVPPTFQAAVKEYCAANGLKFSAWNRRLIAEAMGRPELAEEVAPAGGRTKAAAEPEAPPHGWQQLAAAKGTAKGAGARGGGRGKKRGKREA